MRELTLSELEECAEEVDRVVLASEPHHHFSSTMDWAIAAHRAFGPERMPWLYATPGGYLTFAEKQHPAGFDYLEPLEAQWGLACPLLGAPGEMTEALDRVLAVHEGRWSCAILGGVVAGSALEEEVRERFRVRVQPGMSRFVASLSGGVDGFLARRSRNQRKSITAAARAAASEGITFVDGAGEPPGDSYRRMLSVEQKSWKGRKQTGLCEEPLASFCRHLLERLAKNRRLRLCFAQKEGEDVGYIFGAVFGGAYRGLQFSYAESQKQVALGSALQFHQIGALCAEGVNEYDLGTTSPHYKQRWAETEVISRVLVVRRGW